MEVVFSMAFFVLYKRTAHTIYCLQPSTIPKTGSPTGTSNRNQEKEKKNQKPGRRRKVLPLIHRGFLVMEQIQSFTLSTLESGEEIHTDIVLTVYANKVFLSYIQKYS